MTENAHRSKNRARNQGQTAPETGANRQCRTQMLTASAEGIQAYEQPKQAFGKIGS
jgi:hypothetical protein